MTEPDSKKANRETTETGSSVSSFVKKHYRALLPLAAAGVLVAIALYIALRPGTSASISEKPLSKSKKVLVLAKDLLRQNRPAEAVDLLKQHLLIHRQDQEVRLRLAELYMQLGNLDLSETTLTQALAITPDNAQVIWAQGMVVMYRGGNPEQYFRRAAQMPNAPADVLGNYGLFLLSQNQPEEAKKYLQRAVDGETGNGLVYAELGKQAFEKNRLDEAYRLLKRATELTPQSVEAWAVLAEIQKNRNEPAQAIASLNKALQVAGGAQRGTVLMELGRAQIARQNWDQAAEMFSQATDYPAVRTQAAYWAARCHYVTKTYAKAMFYIDKACAAKPDEPTFNEWKQKIENARYGQPADEQPAPSLLELPPEVKTKPEANENQ